jgi:glycerol kinase
MLLAIDIGTSGCKLTLFREDGTPAAFETEGYPLYTPAPRLGGAGPGRVVGGRRPRREGPA